MTHASQVKTIKLARFSLGVAAILAVSILLFGGVAPAHANSANKYEDVNKRISDVFERDFASGLRSLKRRGERGDAASALAVATMYRIGLGLEADSAQSKRWAKKAADLDDPRGLYLLAIQNLAETDEIETAEDSLEQLTRAADQGHVKSMYLAGRILESSSETTKRNLAAAKKWYEKAASQKFPFAMWRLGNMLASGKKKPKVLKRGTRMLKAAADRGVISANADYAKRLYHGIGVVQNYTSAFDYYRSAARLGHNGARNMVAYMLFNSRGTGTFLRRQAKRKGKKLESKDVVNIALGYLFKAALSGHPQAQYNLAAYFERRKSPVLAHTFFNLASSQGVAAASIRRRALERTLKPGQISLAQRYASKLSQPDRKPLMRRAGTGSGFFISHSGALVTNHHVVDNCDAVFVRIGEKRHKAQVKFAREDIDISVINIVPKDNQSHEFKVAKFAAKGEIFVGERVAVFGWPFSSVLSEEGTFTLGTLSSTKGIRGNRNFFQMSAPVNPGNSGGPVFGESGAILGAVTSRLAANSQQNINFAVKNTPILDTLEEFQQMHHFSDENQTTNVSSRELYKIATKVSAQIQCFEIDISKTLKSLRN